MLTLAAGRGAGRELLGPVTRWRTPARWYAVTLAGPAVVVLAAVGLDRLLGGRVVAFNDPAQWWLGIVVFAYVLVLGGPLGEEIGWRGFALSPLQARFSPVPVSLLLGVVSSSRCGGWRHRTV